MAEHTQIRKTKKLETIFRRYNVGLRKRNSTVVHVTTGETTDCDPLVFAVYEAAIKSVYLSNALHPLWATCCAAGHDRHYRRIARQDGFDLPDPSEVQEKNREKRGKQGAADYGYCVSLISKAGLYYALLD